MQATIANNKLRCPGIVVYCQTLGCKKVSTVSYEVLGLPDETVFTDIPKLKRLMCSNCGVRSFTVMPDWRLNDASDDDERWRGKPGIHR